MIYLVIIIIMMLIVIFLLLVGMNSIIVKNIQVTKENNELLRNSAELNIKVADILTAMKKVVSNE